MDPIKDASHDATEPLDIKPYPKAATRPWKAPVMANWRDRGYVPDSDDEEEDEEEDVRRVDLVLGHGNTISVEIGSASKQSRLGRSTEQAQCSLNEAPTSSDGQRYSIEGRENRSCEPSSGRNDSSLHRESHEDDSSLCNDTRNGHGGTEAPVSSSLPPGPGESTAGMLEAELRKGMRTIQDILGSLNRQGDDDTDSPLSSLPSSIAGSPRSTPPGGPSAPPATTGRNERSDGPELAEGVDEHPMRRSFRPRAPIQVHPYALEDARYRQTLKSRGLKPVPLQQIILPPHNVSEEDSQGADTYGSSQTRNSDTQSRPSTPISKNDEEESQSPVRGTRLYTSGPSISFGDDLPDLSDILKGPATQTLANALKRRRHPKQSRKTPTTIADSHIYDLPEERNVLESAPRAKSPSFQIPPSPPRSRGTLSSQDGLLPDIDEFLPGNTTPALLPTPLLSSERQGIKRAHFEALDSSDSEQVIISDDSSATSSAADSSDDESQGIQRMRRKIKGVLPASWLKLDSKQRDNKLASRHQARSPVKPALEKGVAQHVPPSSARRTDIRTTRFMHTDAIYTTSDSDSEGPSDPPINLLDGDAQTWFENDIVEEDTVDAMLAPRSRNTSSKGKHRIAKEVGSKPAAIRPERQHRHGASSTVGPRSKHVSLPRKRLKKAHQKPKLTILDAPGFKEEKIPLFLRIARRRGGRSGQSRPQDPSKKFFKLATTGDTLDVNKELGRWRAHRRTTAHVSDYEGEPIRRSPFDPQPGSANGTCHDLTDTTSNKASTQFTHLKETTQATLQRIQNNKAVPRYPQPEHDLTRQNRSARLQEYFQPRQPRRSRPRSSRQYDSATEHTEAALNTQDRLPPLVRRVPRPPPVRMQACGQSLTQHPPSSTISDRLGRSRVPKKQAPRALEVHADVMARREATASPLVDGFEDLNLHNRADIISQAINNPPGTTVLQNVHFFQNSMFLQDAFRILNPASIHLSTLFGPARGSSTITTPKSGRTLVSSTWSADVESIIRESFTEIGSILCGDTNPAGAGRDEYALLLTACAESVASIITYVNQSLTLSGAHELEAFIGVVIDDIDRLRQDIETFDTAKSTLRLPGTLAVLNRLIVLAQGISRISKSITLAITIDLKVLKTNQMLVKLASSLVLRQETTDTLFSYIARQSGSPAVPDVSRLDIPADEIETIALVHQLHPGQSWLPYLKNLPSKQPGGERAAGHPAEILAYIILVIGCVCTALSNEECVVTAPASPGSSVCSGFSMLPAAMTDFLKFFAQEMAAQGKPKRTNYGQLVKLKQFGLVAFQWCLILARTSEGDIANNLLKQMFKQYSDKSNNMLDFFSRTSIQVPRFLERLVGISELVPEPGDTDFHLFLKLTAFTLAVQPSCGSQDSEQLRKLKLRKVSLVFSLLPNNGRDIGDDKPLLVEESSPLSVEDLAAVANRYLLFSTLYHYAPVGVKPEISKVKDLVEFGNAHDAVCTLTLRCWASTVRSAIPQPASESELHELAVWIHDMIFKISDKLKTIPTSDKQKLGDDGIHWYELTVHQRNLTMAISRFNGIAKTYVEAIELCLTEPQARCLLTGDRFRDIIWLGGREEGLSDRAISAIFDVLTAYLKKASNAPTDFLKMLREELRRITFSQLSRYHPLDDMLLVSLVETWYTLANILVEQGNNTWDDYWSKWGHFSIYRYGDFTDSTRHYRILMTSKIASCKDFVGPHIYDFLSSWLTAILGPEDDIGFEHLLTNTLVKTFPDFLDFAGLRTRLAEAVPNLNFTRADLLDYRLEIVLHVIRSLHYLQTTDERQLSDIECLTKAHADKLLETITGALKETWVQLEGEARNAWSDFIHAVVFELSRYSFPTFRIDPWFLDAEDIQLKDKILHLERLFVRRFGESAHIDDEYAVRTFRIACELAVVHGTKEELIQHLASTLSASDPKYIDDEGRFMLNITAQLRFIKAVFPIYMERVVHNRDPNILLGPLVMVIATEVCKRLETRVDLEDQSHMEQFAETMVVLMSAAVKTLQSELCDFRRASGLKLRALANLVSLCGSVCSRWAHLHLLFPTSTAILALQSDVQTYGLYVYEYTCSALDLPCAPTDPEFWATYPDSRMRSAKDFGFHLNDLESSDAEDIAALQKVAKDDLRYSFRNLWASAPTIRARSAWRYKRAGTFESILEPDGPAAEEAQEDVRWAVEELVRALELLGVK